MGEGKGSEGFQRRPRAGRLGPPTSLEPSRAVGGGKVLSLGVHLLVGLVQELLEIGRHEVRPLNRAVVPLQVLHCRETGTAGRREGCPESRIGGHRGRAGRAQTKKGGLGSQGDMEGHTGRGRPGTAHTLGGGTHTLPTRPSKAAPQTLTSPHLLYSSTSACFPSSELPFNKMSLSSGDMK